MERRGRWSGQGHEHEKKKLNYLKFVCAPEGRKRFCLPDFGRVKLAEVNVNANVKSTEAGGGQGK